MRHVVLLLILAVAARAQDPYTLLPRQYRLEFDNPHVRVSRVFLRPGERLPEHQHPAWPTVYVYLTDGGPVRFTHVQPRFTITRPPVTAGALRFNRNAQQETHEVEYLGDVPSEYLRVELKTVPDRPHRDARLPASDQQGFEDAQVHISPATCSPTAPCPVPTRCAVVVRLADRSALWWHPAASQPLAPPREPTRQITIELKTDPQAEAAPAHAH